MLRLVRTTEKRKKKAKTCVSITKKETANAVTLADFSTITAQKTTKEESRMKKRLLVGWNERLILKKMAKDWISPRKRKDIRKKRKKRRRMIEIWYLRVQIHFKELKRKATISMCTHFRERMTFSKNAHNAYIKNYV